MEGFVKISAQEYRSLIEQKCMLIRKLGEVADALVDTVDTYDSSRSLFVRDRAVIRVIERHFPAEYKDMMEQYEAEWAKREAEKEADDK